MRPAQQWLRIVKPSANPRTRIVCFPHAGGTAGFYQAWGPLVPDDVELRAVRYPGREDRLVDPLAETMEALVAPTVAECLPLLDRPLALFGHSMGASVAFEVARRLYEVHGARIAGLFVSGRSGPGRESTPEQVYSTSSDAELVEHLKELGGTDAAALDHPDLLELVLPAIRSDYRIVEEYRAGHTGAVLDTPVVAYYGDDDDEVDAGSVAAWASVTRARFTARSFEGGHFYLSDHRAGLLRDVLSRIGAPAVT
ncbi:thioesterase domain-containing protein [Streptomyces sp. NPDC088135]|uniref:thioesterase II family protein n=1 Tax=Streptomyces sp. NPDC088135 TaxID=3160993 RepID=UPI00341B634E